MPIPYSQDLRMKVINLINKGTKQIEVARLLGIDKSTIYRWYRNYKQLGHCNVKVYHNNQDKIKVSKDKVINIIEQNPHYTQKVIANKIGNITPAGISKILKKLGYTFKKDLGYTKKEIKI